MTDPHDAPGARGSNDSSHGRHQALDDRLRVPRRRPERPGAVGATHAVVAGATDVGARPRVEGHEVEDERVARCRIGRGSARERGRAVTVDVDVEDVGGGTATTEHEVREPGP